MVGYFSIRVPWHDGGWKGSVCSAPENNGACCALKGIAEKRNSDTGIKCEACANTRKNEWDTDFTPPCLKENGFFLSDEEHSFVERHPYSFNDAFKHIQPATIVCPPHSFNGTPYKWMLKPGKDGPSPLDYYYTGYDPEIEPMNTPWISHGENQRKIFEYFWSEAKTEDSLIIAYAKAIPLTDTPGRIVVAISAVKNLGELSEYPYDESKRQEESVPALSWERLLGHYIQDREPQGFVFPFEQIADYLTSNPTVDPDELLLIVPDAYRWEFSYAAERISSESVIVVLGKAIELLKKYEELKFAPPAGTSWKKLVTWLQARLKKAWLEREIYPGLGAVLEALGVRYGADIAKILWKEAKDSQASWQGVTDNLGDVKALKKLLPEKLKPVLKLKDDRGKFLITPDTLANAADSLADNLDENRNFWELVSRIPLSFDQAQFIAIAYEGKLPWGCSRYLTRLGELNGRVLGNAVLENPYTLYEETRLLPDNYKISLQQIDLAMFPPDYIAENIFDDAKFERIEYPDDKRRLRALITNILEDEASRGHTLFLLNDVIEKVNSYRVDSSPIDIAADVKKKNFERHREFFSQLFIEKEITLYDENNEPKTVTALQLQRYAEAEATIRDFVKARLERGTLATKAKNWEETTRKTLEAFPANADKVKDEESIKEKTKALEKLYDSPLSVLTGGAGTGKTLTLAILCEDKQIQENGILVLAPTGKARMVLSSYLKKKGIEHRAQTIFQFLLHCGHAAFGNYATFVCGKSEDNPPQTVIIDESSMITEESFAALCEALADAKRIIFAGDPNQLPPIGAGKPFFELCQKLSAVEEQPHYAELKISNRQNCGKDIQGLDTRFARFFTMDGNSEDRKTLSEAIGEGGPIEFVPCDKPQDLKTTLKGVVERVFAEINGGENTKNPLLNFDKSLGAEIANGKYVNFKRHDGVENWQILTPYRNRPYVGSGIINRDIHEDYALGRERAEGLYKRIVPDRYRLGTEGIVLGEKVINLKNEKDGWNKRNVWNFGSDSEEFYTANGEIGIVHMHDKAQRNTKGVTHNVLFSSQPGLSYKYRSGANEDGPLELAYALTVHKAQGSGFGYSILILLDDGDSPFISREMLYTALTRQKNKLYIITNKKPWELLELAGVGNSETARRMSSIFGQPVFRSVKGFKGWYDDRLIHRASDGTLLRSKSELLIYEKMLEKALKPLYEKELSWDEGDRVLPDFTLSIGNREIYWEHLGMLGNAGYRKHWESKKRRYAEHGISEEEGNLILSKDDEYTGAFDAGAIEELINGLIARK